MSGLGPRLTNPAQPHRGACRPCKTIYNWFGRPRLSETTCPKCGRNLTPTRGLSVAREGTEIRKPPKASGVDT